MEDCVDDKRRPKSILDEMRKIDLGVKQKKNSDRGQVWGRKGGMRRRGRWKDDRERDITQRRLKVTDRQDCKRVRDPFLMRRHLMCQSRIKRFSKLFFFFF